MERQIRLRSGKWTVRLEQDAGRGEYLHLVRADHPGESMRVHLPFSWRSLDQEGMTELARRPEIRMWCDDLGIQWRVAAVGPGTPYPFPLPGSYLVFDSQETWAGLTPVDGGVDLGDLTHDELIDYRNRISDLGGDRRRFRPPADVQS